MLYKRILITIAFFFMASFGYSQAPIAPHAIFAEIKKVADWQIADIEKNGWRWPSTDWTNGAYYAGQLAWAKIANDQKQLDFLISVGEKNKWEGGPEKFFADDYCVGQTYAQLFMLYKDSTMIKPMIKLCDDILARPHIESLVWNFDGGLHNREWAWCDALFMGPPTLAYIYKVTGNKKYLDGMNELWWRSSDYLYDTKEHLYFRDSRFFNQKEKNGAKVFWSRGNGWVIAALTRILDNMPADYPARPRYLKIFKDMATRISSLQQPDGTWHASLLDPKSFPVKETSGTAFFTYSLAWGVNRGYLPYEKYFPVIKKAWTALNDCVHPDGKLGFVQVPGASPEKVGYDDSEVYGTGAYLLAGTELFKMMFGKEVAAKKTVIHNSLPLDRREEMVELKWTQFAESKFDPSKTIVVNAQTNEEIPSQIIYNGTKTPVSIIFQSGITAGSTGYYYFKKQKPKTYAAKTYGRQVPERFDDFAWENDKIAFRMYGAALDNHPDNAKGIDLWLKKTNNLVINKWYKQNDYHIDHGEGVDAYHVGMTLGAGNSEPLSEKGLAFSGNYSDYKILDQGPLRIAFELIYKPWQVNGQEVQQVKTISLDAGSNLNKIKDDYEFEGKTLTIAAGVTKHNDDGNPVIDSVNRFVSYWDQADGKVDNGKVGVAIMVPGYEAVSFKNELGHLLSVANLNPGQPFIYYQGGAWNRSGFFPDEQAWIDYLVDYHKKLKNPLEISY
ncbi:MAG: glycoside hydrolase family 88 protein [Ginsengibacter sp.]